MTYPVREEHLGRGWSVLSERERQVAAMICAGRERGEIARELSISIRTVDTHRQRLLYKVGVANSVQLVCRAIRDGFSSMHDGGP